MWAILGVCVLYRCEFDIRYIYICGRSLLIGKHALSNNKFEDYENTALLLLHTR